MPVIYGSNLDAVEVPTDLELVAVGGIAAKRDISLQVGPGQALGPHRGPRARTGSQLPDRVALAGLV